MHLGSTVFGYFVLAALLTVILTAVFSPQVWRWTWNNAALSTGILIALFQVYVLDKFIGDRWLSDGYRVSKPGAWTWFSATCSLAAVITGVIASVLRFAYLVFISLASVFVLDATYFPAGLVSYDSGYSAFMSVVAMQHRHRSPVLTTAGDVVFGADARRDAVHQQRSPASLRARQRWQLALTLFNNPSTMQLRGHALAARKSSTTTASEL